MTLSKLISLAGKRGYMFDEKAFRDGRGYVFFTTFDGYSRSDVAFDTVSDAERYFKNQKGNGDVKRIQVSEYFKDKRVYLNIGSHFAYRETEDVAEHYESWYA